MERGIVLYQSKYGSTEKYARWLAEESGYDIIEVKKAKADTMNGYETVILCGGGIRFRNRRDLISEKE